MMCDLLSLVLINSLQAVRGFNVAPEASVVFEDPFIGSEPSARGSFFGYSVGLRGRKQYSDAWVLIGAPRGNLTGHFEGPVGLKEPGVIYKCPVGAGGAGCSQLLMDVAGNTRGVGASGQEYQNLRDQGWLGAALDTQPSERESTITCAPLWRNQRYFRTYLMNGVCYIQNHELRNGTAEKRLPLSHHHNQNYAFLGQNTVFNHAHGELGMSVHFPDEEGTVLMGAPGVFNWQGMVAKLSDAVIEDGGNINKRQTSQSVDPEKRYLRGFVPNPYFTSSIEDSDYFGYSVSSGVFVEGSIHYVGGAPRGANSKGKVLVFQMGSIPESELQILFERSGSQVGEYFGSSVTAVDVTADGLCELVVGAPLHSSHVSVDHGATYYFSNHNGQLSLQGIRLDGTKTPRARFGTSVASAGDLNKDGCNDIVVGAPYDGNGAVYVYLGGVDGLQRTFSQKLHAEQFTARSGRPLQGFGISISRGLDVDDNFYPDFVVGSYTSGHAVLMRTRPVAVLSGTVTSVPVRLSLYDTSFTVTACVTYTGHGVPMRRDVTVTLTLDHQRKLIAPRALFVASRSNSLQFNVTVQDKGRQCRDFAANVQPDRNNAPDPVSIRLEHQIADTSIHAQERPLYGRQSIRPGDISPKPEPIRTPITDPFQRNGTTNYISFVTGCEADGDSSCSSDLSIRASWPDRMERLVIGRQKRITLTVTIGNSGEPAFLPNVTFSVQRPLDLHLPATHTCERILVNNPVMVCRLDNPLGTDKEEIIEIEIDVERLTDSSDVVQVDIAAGSSDIEVTPHNNRFSARLPLAAEAHFTIHGSSLEEQVTYERISPTKINYTASETITFIHQYTIVKRGPTPIGGVFLDIEIPVLDRLNNKLLDIHSPEREFQGASFPCQLSGSKWYMPQGGATVNFTDTGDDDDNYSTHSPSPGERRRRSSSDAHDAEDHHRPEEQDVNPMPLVSCSSTAEFQCALMHCVIASWPHDSASASLGFRISLNISTLARHISVRHGTTLATEAVASIRSVSLTVLFTGDKSVNGTARTLIQAGALPGEAVEWWWYVVAIVLGLLLLAALAFGLFKLGFFKRKKKEELKALHATLVQTEETDNQ